MTVHPTSSAGSDFQSLGTSISPTPGIGRVSKQIIAIDDDPMTLRLLRAHLQAAGHSIDVAENGADGLELVNDSTAVALVDLRMPGLDGFQVLESLRQSHPNVNVIILTGSEEVSDAVQAMRQGAFQFITKPFDPNELVVYVEKAIEAWRVGDENRDLKESHCQNVPVRTIQSSGDMHSRLMQQVNQIASLDSTVFIGGETGTGKSTIARMIHQNSNRSKGPFVTVNCASLPRDLIQSELFGHTKGSFTGAVKDRIGHAEVANGGTLFLDEIGDLPMDLQPKLLTFLQDKTVQRLGATKSKQVDVRLIAATHRDLAAMCREGLFRQDLYFRLLVLNLELPALRFRHGDFESIAESILKSVCERQEIAPKQISGEGMRVLMQHSWPGNIRELENVLERAVAFSRSPMIEPHDLAFSEVTLNMPLTSQSMMVGNQIVGHQVPNNQGFNRVTPQPLHSQSVESAENNSDDSRDQGYQLAGKTLEQIERDAIMQTLEMLGGNKAKTARTLGISEKSIYNKMKRLKIEF